MVFIKNSPHHSVLRSYQLSFLPLSMPILYPLVQVSCQAQAQSQISTLRLDHKLRFVSWPTITTQHTTFSELKLFFHLLKMKIW